MTMTSENSILNKLSSERRIQKLDEIKKFLTKSSIDSIIKKLSQEKSRASLKSNLKKFLTKTSESDKIQEFAKADTAVHQELPEH